MIHGHIALVRQLRAFMETSVLPWGNVRFRYDHDDEERPIYDDHRAEMSFRHNGKDIDVVIFAPSDQKTEGAESLPLGRLAARVDGEVIKGPIDQTVWDQIAAEINKEST
jgi:hypothetical protein